MLVYHKRVVVPDGEAYRILILRHRRVLMVQLRMTGECTPEPLETENEMQERRFVKFEFCVQESSLKGGLYRFVYMKRRMATNFSISVHSHYRWFKNFEYLPPPKLLIVKLEGRCNTGSSIHSASGMRIETLLLKTGYTST